MIKDPECKDYFNYINIEFNKEFCQRLTMFS